MREGWDKVRDNLKNEASTQQTFVDILDNDVIEPLVSLKETNDETRKRIHGDLKESTAEYADYVEMISKLQQVLQRPEDVRNKRFGGKSSAPFRGRREDLRGPEIVIPTESEEVSDDDCRVAVRALNLSRATRVENLVDGYDVSGTLCYDIMLPSNPVSSRADIHANNQRRSYQIYGRYDVSRI